MFKNFQNSFAVKISLLFLLLFFSLLKNKVYSQTVLSAGDIAFVSLELDGSDDYFEFVTLVDLWPCTVVNFTDNMYRTDNTFCTNEFSVGFTVTSKINAGSVIRYTCSAIPGAFTYASGAAIPAIATNNGAGSNNGLSKDDDNVLCYQGSITSPTMIAAIHNNVFTSPGNTCNNSNTSKLPTTLTLGTNAIQLSNKGDDDNDNFKYNCSVASGNRSTLATALNTVSRWTTGAPATCSFTVSSVATCPSGGPVNPPTTFNCTGTTITTASFSWARCNNMEVTVVARKTADAATDPLNGVDYTPNTVYGSGSALGDGFVVYEGTNTSVTITGLTPGTSYTFDIYTYYSTSGICFNTTQLSGTCNTVLPAEFILFNISKENNLILIEWATSSEKNNDHFEIEASKDGINFEKIKSIPAKGSSNQYLYYNESIEASGEYQYFRLKQVDLNGEYKYSYTKTCIEKSLPETVEVFPIPASNELFINSLSAKNFEIVICDLTGKEILTKQFNNESGQNSIDINFLPAGTYILIINKGSQVTSKKFYKL